MRVAVFGGSGFIGSRVCKTLADAGCDVISLSRAGRPPAWAAEEPWSGQVEWLAMDALEDAEITAPLGRIDAAVSCIGNMRPAPNFEPGSFFGLHWNSAAMMRENGEVTARVAEAARGAGARRFACVSVSSSVKWAYGGALEGYIDGKVAAEAAARRAFGDAATCIIGASLVFGGGRLAALGALLAAVCGTPPVRGNTVFFKWLKSSAATGYGPQDAVGEVASTPPVEVRELASAVAAGLLGTLPETLRRAQLEEQRKENEVRGLGSDALGPPFTFIDGTDQIRAAAAAAGTPAALAASVAAWEPGAAAHDEGAPSTSDAPASPAATAIADDGAPTPLQSPSAFGAPFEGALVGFRPFLYPILPGTTLVSVFVGAILLGMHPEWAPPSLVAR